ncbi:MAG: hypothetical protein IBX36_01010 [Dehalococcoidia bacterium]|nr:hypothetical protein [Dehalococcoidia bacterium]
MNGNLITALRQNHALEHATVSLLTRKVGLNVRMVGRTTIDGFYIYGNVPTEAIQEAAAEGLACLQRGESELAVSPFCGTNIVVAGMMAGIASLIALGGKDRRGRLPLAILAATWAIIASQPVGRAVQRYLTTSSSLSDVTIKRITRRSVGTRILHKIETARE